MQTFDSGNDAIVQELLDARRARKALPSLLSNHPELTAGRAYAIAEAIALRRSADGEQSVGRKIGLTNHTVWDALGATEPIWGHVYDSTLVMATGGKATVSLSQALGPRIEPEIGFCLRSAIKPGETDPHALLRCIEWVAPCFELIDSHVGAWKFKAVEAIADFGVHYKLVVGEPYRFAPAEIDALVDALGNCSVTLRCDGAVVDQGRGSNTLGHPLYALAALVDVLVAHASARPLRAGEIITTGTLTAPQALLPGQKWRVEFDGLGLAPLELALV